MSFVAGLLRREFPAAGEGTPSAEAMAASSTTPEPAVLPRLASRFEGAGAPLWPGGGNAALLPDTEPDAEPATGATTGPDSRSGPARTPSTAPPPARPFGAAHALPGPGAVEPGRGSARPPATARPGSPAPAQPPAPVERGGHGLAPHQLPSAEPSPRPVPRRAAHAGQGTAAEAPGGLRGQVLPAAPAQPAGTVRGQAADLPNPGPEPRAQRLPTQPPPATGTLRPRLEPLLRREASRAPEQHIHVHIGRIEVKAATAPAQRPSAPERPGLMSLDEYLADRP
ncbi:hypothetical protein B5P43_17900 [Bacillus sp. SRB_336]|nr:hypothetical protein B5P43_17900 [Bacillus sp. SRB_336]